VSNRSTSDLNRDGGGRDDAHHLPEQRRSEKKRASARWKNGGSGEEEGGDELITRRNGANWRAVTLAFPRAPPLLPPARAEPKISAAAARTCTTRA
jgi:hypothetical protein